MEPRPFEPEKRFLGAKRASAGLGKYSGPRPEKVSEHSNSPSAGSPIESGLREDGVGPLGGVRYSFQARADSPANDRSRKLKQFVELLPEFPRRLDDPLSIPESCLLAAP